MIRKVCALYGRNIVGFRSFATKIQKEMKYLNVAEKNDAAKTIAGLLSNGAARRREGLSVYNKIYDFEVPVRGTKSKMVMTSVSGHLLELEFLQSYRNWKNCDPVQLFDAKIQKICKDDYLPIKKTLEREIKSCQGLIIWTDCDREGENIGFEIIDVCKAIKPNITVQRAKFSEITSAAVRRALANLTQPDKYQSDAVDVRSELDLRTGAAITRLQTMRLQRLFPEKISNKLISYGSCQIPTLGFVAERYKEIEAFVSEPFWKIKVTHTIDDLTVDFNWARNRLFDKEACEDFYMLCLADPKAKVISVTTKPKSKWRPTPMDTVEMEKIGSRKLKMPAKEIMTIAEKLYTQGIISYPRTETNMFSKEIDLKHLVEQHLPHPEWGDFARRVIDWGPNPRNGNKSDQAHPPIHPTKLVTNLTGNEGRVYELIVRHFLACVSKDATGSETVVNINIAGEKFTATGLYIYERNYLDVYIYEKWNAKEIHKYEIDQIFDPTEISMQEGATTAPPLLTEADLIALMEKHGIGTDATHAEHINTIKERGYIGEADRGSLVPGIIGMGLYEGYDAMELILAKPVLRAEFEADLKKICLGQKNPKAVLAEQIQKYKEAYKVITEKIVAMDEKMAQRVNETPRVDSGNDQPNNWIRELFKCPKCRSSQMALRKKKDSMGSYIGCLNFPDCKNAVWLSDDLKEVSATDENCRRCGSASKLLKVKLNTSYRSLFDVHDGWYTTCLRCDSKFRETFNINADQVKPVGAIVGDTQQPRSAPTINKNQRKPPGPSGGKAVTKIKNGTQHTSTRSFASSPSTLFSADVIQEFFDSNDEFDDIIVNANLNEIIQPPSVVNVSETNRHPPPSVSNNQSQEYSSMLVDDDFETYAWGSANRDITSGNNSESRITNHQEPQAVFPRQAPVLSQVNQNTSVKCTGCHLLAKELTVKKEGPNKGRTFYACPNSCKFFQWADENTSPSVDTVQSRAIDHEPRNTQNVVENGIECNCKMPANRLIVRKDGPNQGRPFYGCANRNKSCGFFKWDDEDNTVNQIESWGTGNVRRSVPESNRPTTSGRSNAGTQNNPQKRKCGICRQEGHTRSKCPRKAEFEM